MSWASIAQQLALAAGKAVIGLFTRSDDSRPSNSSEPSDTTAARTGAASGEAARREGHIAERNAHASLEERLNAKLAKK
jgi:hypothetical protein